MPSPQEFTHQRIYKETKRKLAALSDLEGRSAPQQLKVIIDREYQNHPEADKPTKTEET